MYDTYMNTPGNTAKPRAIHSNIQTAQRRSSLVGNEPTIHLSVATPLSKHSNPLCQPGIAFGELKLDQTWFKLSTSTFMPG